MTETLSASTLAVWLLSLPQLLLQTAFGPQSCSCQALPTKVPCSYVGPMQLEPSSVCMYDYFNLPQGLCKGMVAKEAFALKESSEWLFNFNKGVELGPCKLPDN